MMITYDHWKCTDPRDSEPQPQKQEELPADYEQCGECGFDHEYEPEEAAKIHKEIDDYDPTPVYPWGNTPPSGEYIGD